jgi:hypothetical protein
MATDDKSPPSPNAVMDRALSFALEGLQAADLQLQRARQEAPPQPGGAFLWWIDLQFFIVALRRLRRAAELARRVPDQRPAVQRAIQKFDDALPDLLLLRDVGEHIEDYAVDKGRNSSVRWRALQVGGWDGVTFDWLGTKLNADVAMDAARKLVGEIEWARQRVLYPERFRQPGKSL